MECVLKYDSHEEALSALNAEAYWNVIDEFAEALLDLKGEEDSSERSEALDQAIDLLRAKLIDQDVMIPSMFRAEEE